jgi:hypothetical protein
MEEDTAAQLSALDAQHAKELEILYEYEADAFHHEQLDLYQAYEAGDDPAAIVCAMRFICSFALTFSQERYEARLAVSNIIAFTRRLVHNGSENRLPRRSNHAHSATPRSSAAGPPSAHFRII